MAFPEITMALRSMQGCFAERMQRGNKKLRKALVKEAQALIEGRQTLTEIKRLLKEKKKGVTVENMQGYS